MSEEKNTASEEIMESKDSPSLPDSSAEDKVNKSDSSDWREKIFEMDFLSPIYFLLFVILFKDGENGVDLHDAIINFVMTYNN